MPRRDHHAHAPPDNGGRPAEGGSAAARSRPSPSPLRRTIRRLRRRLEPRVVVLMYHRVADVPCDPWEQCVKPDHFDEQLSALRRRVDVIPLTDVPARFGRGLLPSRAVVITFDDGYADNLTTARPLLEKHELPATFFLTAGAIDREREFWWDELERIFLHPGVLPERLELTIGGRRHGWSLNGEVNYEEAQWHRSRQWRASDPPATVRQRVYYAIWDEMRPLPPSSQEEVLEELTSWAGISRAPRPTHRILTRSEASMLGSGPFELGAHTMSHVALSSQPLEAQRSEIRSSKHSVESIMRRPVTHFAYPYGDFSEETKRAVQEAGFEGAVSTREGVIGRRSSPWQWPRYKVCDWNGPEFSRRLAAMFNAF